MFGLFAVTVIDLAKGWLCFIDFYIIIIINNNGVAGWSGPWTDTRRVLGSNLGV